MGEATAMALARYGATVVIHGRDAKKAEEAVAAIKEATNNPGVYFLIADMGRLEDVRGLAANFRKDFHRLDILVNNAGAVFGKRTESMDGLEMTFQVNYLSHFLLTNLLLDMLKDHAPSRVVNVSAAQHERGRIDFEDLQMARKYTAQKAYASSKLAQVLFTYEMARRLDGTEVTSNASNPGIAKTHLGYDAGLLTSLSKRMTDLFGKSAEKGAETTIYLAASKDVEGISGRYFEDMKEGESSEMSYNTDTAKRLWDLSLELCGLVKGPPG
jgi:NAD(P)-dependent dehydrogenase (short-subunit alcohol dehydrogenase family)